MKTLRTPDERFEDLPGWPYAPHYTEVPDGDGGTLRIHHVDEGPPDGAIVLCMHGQPTWSYLYRHMIPLLTAEGLRVIAPDLVGYGRSDKPAALDDYSYGNQVAWLEAWLLANDLRDVSFVGQDWGGLIGLRLVAAHADRFAGVCIANTGMPVPPATLPEERIAAVARFREGPTPTMPEVMQAIASAREKGNFEFGFAHWQKWCRDTEDLPVSLAIAGIVDGRTLTPEEIAAYDAPYPDASYKMGPRAMPTHVPTLPDDPSREPNIEAWKVFDAWEKPFVCAFTDNDPVSAGAEQPFLERVPKARNLPIEGGGHFLQEGRAEAFVSRVLETIRG